MSTSLDADVESGEPAQYRKDQLEIVSRGREDMVRTDFEVDMRKAWRLLRQMQPLQRPILPSVLRCIRKHQITTHGTRKQLFAPLVAERAHA